MRAVRKIVDSEKLMTIVDLPKGMRTGKLELIILPTTAVDTASQKTGDPASMLGRLREYANPDLIPLEEGAWERHVAEKYART